MKENQRNTEILIFVETKCIKLLGKKCCASGSSLCETLITIAFECANRLSFACEYHRELICLVPIFVINAVSLLAVVILPVKGECHDAMIQTRS